MSDHTVPFGDMEYAVEVIRRHQAPSNAPRLIAVCYNTTTDGVDVTRVFAEAVMHLTPPPFELWIVDNASPPAYCDWLRDLPGVNVILNHTPPIPRQNQGRLTRWGVKKVKADDQMPVGSYANAIGLELGMWAIDPQTPLVFAMHNDVLPLQPHWLDYLRSKMSDQVRAVGTRRDKHPKRIEALHVSGLLFDHQLFRQLEVSFFPALPRLDVGDRISQVFEGHDYQTYLCRNSYNEPSLAEWVTDQQWVDKLPHITWTFDDDRTPIYAHLGRGTPKSKGTYWKEGRATSAGWVDFAREVVLADG